MLRNNNDTFYNVQGVHQQTKFILSNLQRLKLDMKLKQKKINNVWRSPVKLDSKVSLVLFSFL